MRNRTSRAFGRKGEKRFGNIVQPKPAACSAVDWRFSRMARYEKRNKVFDLPVSLNKDLKYDKFQTSII